MCDDLRAAEAEAINTQSQIKEDLAHIQAVSDLLEDLE